MEVNKETKNWKTKIGAKSVILVCDAQVEVQAKSTALDVDRAGAKQ